MDQDQTAPKEQSDQGFILFATLEQSDQGSYCLLPKLVKVFWSAFENMKQM